MSQQRRYTPRTVAVLSSVVVALCVGLLSPSHVPTARAQAEDGLEIVGELEFPWGERPTRATLAAIDVEGRRLYTQFSLEGSRIGVYDLDSPVPAPIRISEPDIVKARVFSPNTVVLDRERGRMLILGLSDGDRSVIEVLDLERLEKTATWELAATVPGYFAMGIVHDPRLDRLYLTGSFEASAVAHDLIDVAGTTGASPGAAVVALDAATGEFLWADMLTGCDQPLFAAGFGGQIGLAADRPMVYTFCKAGALAYQPSGQGGLVRLDITDSAASSGLVDFPMEFFPVSGNFSGVANASGVAGFDPVGERFFGHSLSPRTHGAWVFDGLRSSWVGFIASPDSTNRFFGIDPVHGTHYMGGGQHGSGWINVADARATPISQGQLFSTFHVPRAGFEEIRLDIDGATLVDPVTRRAFVPFLAADDRGEFIINLGGWLVLQDSTRPIQPLEPVDYDRLTGPLADADAQLEFSGRVSGFGAQYAAVGGWETVYSRATVPFFGILQEFVPQNPAGIQYGTRGATMAFVDEAGIEPAGSKATAQAARQDDATDKDAAGQTGGGDPPSSQFPNVTCLDGAGEPIANEAGADSAAAAAVACDLAKLRTTATAAFSDGASAGGVSVVSSSFGGSTVKDERGAVTTATAVADGIAFGSLDLGGVLIDRVTTTVTTVANGLDGTSAARWERVVEGARIVDALGNQQDPQSCRTVVESGKDPVEEGDCTSLEAQANNLLKNRFKMRFPLPEVVATPRGAFASIQETLTDYLNGLTTNDDILRAIPGLEVTAFNDGPEKGRLIVQMAAIRADSTFIRSPKSTFTPFVPPTEQPGTPTAAPEVPVDQPLPDDGVAAPPPIDAGGEPPRADDAPPMVAISHEERLVGAFGWLPAVRNLSQGLLVGALYLLFALPVAESVRRRRLLHVLMDDATPTTHQRSSS